MYRIRRLRWRRIRAGKRCRDIIDEVVKAKVKVFAFSRYVPTGGEVDTSMTPQEYRDLLEICDAKYQAYEKAGCETYFNKKDHLWTLYEYETGQFKLPSNADQNMIYGGCNCGNCHITILSNGDIMACRRVTNSFQLKDPKECEEAFQRSLDRLRNSPIINNFETKLQHRRNKRLLCLECI